MDVVLASAYMPYDSAQPPSSKDISGLIEDCKAKRRKLIIGSDANSHPTVEGSSGVNRRLIEGFERLIEGFEIPGWKVNRRF